MTRSGFRLGYLRDSAESISYQEHALPGHPPQRDGARPSELVIVRGVHRSPAAEIRDLRDVAPSHQTVPETINN